MQWAFRNSFSYVGPVWDLFRHMWDRNDPSLSSFKEFLHIYMACAHGMLRSAVAYDCAFVVGAVCGSL